MLLEKWQRGTASSGAAEPARRPEPAGAGPLFATAMSAPPPRGRSFESMAPCARRRAARSAPSRSWVAPRSAPSRLYPPRTLWDDPSRNDDEDEPPRGLWSGWAR